VSEWGWEGQKRMEKGMAVVDKEKRVKKEQQTSKKEGYKHQ